MAKKDTHSSKFEPELVLAIASGLNPRTAAKHAGVRERTAYRRMEDPEFRKAVSDARHAMLYEGVGVLTAGLKSAVTRLLALTTDKDKKIAHAAIRTLLSETTKMTELLDLSERMKELEERMNDVKGDKGWRGGGF